VAVPKFGLLPVLTTPERDYMKNYAKTSPVTITTVLIAAVVFISQKTGNPVTETDAAFYIAAVAVVVNEIARRKEQILGFVREVGAAFRGE